MADLVEIEVLYDGEVATGKAPKDYFDAGAVVKCGKDTAESLIAKKRARYIVKKADKKA